MEKLNGTNLVAPVQGKLTEITTITTQSGKNFYRHILAAPAKDEYSHPDTVCVLSERRIGDQGQEITVQVRIRGRRNRAQSGHTFYNHELWEQM